MGHQVPFWWSVLALTLFVGFAGAGSISDAVNHFDLDNTKPSYGGGLRFKINRKENVNVRVDYGFGNGQQNVYFFIAEAF